MGREIEKTRKPKTPVKSNIQNAIESLVQDGLSLKMEGTSVKVELQENTDSSSAEFAAMTSTLTATNLMGTQSESRQAQ